MTARLRPMGKHQKLYQQPHAGDLVIVTMVYCQLPQKEECAYTLQTLTETLHLQLGKSFVHKLDDIHIK